MKAVIISASSDIGTAAARRWIQAGWSVHGTYRSRSSEVDELASRGAELVPCDLANTDLVSSACHLLSVGARNWDVLVLAAGATDPVGSFRECEFGQWEGSIRVNFISQLQIVRELLDARSKAGRAPTVLFFAGGGTNSAVINYSAYTVSKIALMKMCELLDAEVPDTKFVIIGPGWVKTKIHQATLRAGQKAGANYQRTLDMFAASRWTPMERVLECCEWAIRAEREVVSGKNFSVAHDLWGTEELDALLRSDNDLYKLRRHGNDIRPMTERKRADQ